MAGFFENLRSNTQAMINTNMETEKTIKGSVLPIMERLHKEIKHKTKELDKLRNATQKHIEMLGQQTASFDSAGGKIHGHDDPYVIFRGVQHRLSSQVVAENNHRNDVVAVQNSFRTFEAHILEVFQQVMEAFVQLAGGQGEKTRKLYADMLRSIQAVPTDFEWAKFQTRCADRLVNPNDPPRSVEAIQIPNMDHALTKPLIEGSLERKSRNKLSWGFSAGYYAVTPSKFLHEFKDSDDTRQDPKPELSIYLPDAIIGAPNSDRFNVKGKDRSKTISSKLTGSSELALKAHSPEDAQKWFQVIRTVCGATGPAEPSSPAAESPVATKVPSDERLVETKTGIVSSDEKLVEDKAETKVAETPTQGHKAQEAGVTGAQAAPVAAAAAAAPSAPMDEKKS